MFVIAAAGLIVSAIAHIGTFLGISPQPESPSVWALQILIFVVWIPVVWSCRKIGTRKEGRKKFWKIATRNAPMWMRVLCVALAAYAFFNFFYGMAVLNVDNSPYELDGQKFIQRSDGTVQELTDEEFKWQQAYSVRAFSGHWMIFYAIGMTVLYSRSKDDSICDHEQNPQDGHTGSLD